jgi:integrase
MARTIGRLSAVKVQGLKAPGYYADGGNLYFRIASGGSKSWILRFVLHGRTRDMGLGRYPDLSLARARQKAGEYRELIVDGVDPIERRKKQRMEAALASTRGMTFKQCAEAYIAAHESSWRNAKHRQQWTNTLETYVYPTLGPLSVQDINVSFVLRVLQPIWNTKPETASRVRSRIEAILDWAKAREYRSGENPARWRGNLHHLLPPKSKVRKVVHHAAVPYGQIGPFMAALRRQPGAAARALEFLILTATRTGETLGATWDEVDHAEGTRVWTIPDERMKGGREHRIPLSAVAVAVLDDMRKLRQNDFVFPGARDGRPLSEMALRRMGYGHVTVHGFRSSFRDWAAERTMFAREVAEMALAHAIPDAVEAAYRRGDLFEKRRKLMDAWAAFCAKAETSCATKVIAIAAHRP